MNSSKQLEQLLEAVSIGALSPAEAAKQLQLNSSEELGFACLDHHRKDRQGFAEVVYCEGKTEEQSLKILCRLAEQHDQVLGSRASQSLANQVLACIPEATYDPLARMIVIEKVKLPADSERYILIAAAGTSDLPVAEEARITAQIMGNRVETLYDVGVAGIHRLLGNVPIINHAKVIIVVAGMEGALASVVGGLTDKPIVAVPTSIGYGASFGGISALLGMLTSCASGIGVVNIDNGFGAACMASKINKL